MMGLALGVSIKRRVGQFHIADVRVRGVESGEWREKGEREDMLCCLL